MLHPRRTRNRQYIGYTEFKPVSQEKLYELAGRDTYEAYEELEEQLLLNLEIPDEQLLELWKIFMKEENRLICYWRWKDTVRSGVSADDAEKYMKQFEKKLSGLYRLKCLAPDFYKEKFNNVTGAHLIFMYLANLFPYLRRAPDDSEITVAGIPYPDKARQDKKIKTALIRLGFENISGVDMWEASTYNLHFFQPGFDFRTTYSALGYELLADVMDTEIFIEMDMRDRKKCRRIIETVLGVELENKETDTGEEKNPDKYSKNLLSTIDAFIWITDTGDKLTDEVLKKEAEKLRFLAARKILISGDAELMMAAYDTGLILKEDTPQLYVIAKNLKVVKLMPYLILQQHGYC